MNKRWIMSAAAVLVLTACQNTHIPLDSRIDLPEHYTQNATARGQAEIGQWWRNWHDPVLNQLIEQGLAQNHDIAIAQARLAEARQVSRMAHADLGPMVGATARTGIHSANMDDISTTINTGLPMLPSIPITVQGPNADGNQSHAAIVASWEPDIFGQKRSDADAAKYAALGTQEKLYGAQMLVAGDIAINYFQARAAQERLASMNRSVAAVSELLRYVQGRFTAGQVTGYEVDETQSKLNGLKARQSMLNAEYAAKVRSIAVLTGQVPQNFILPASGVNVLARIPDAPSGQYPGALLERRPDIRAYAAQVNAYAAKLASAKADLLPRFDIQFLGGRGRIELDSDTPALKGWGSLLSAGITVPIFTNGRIQANIAASDARLQAALLQYDQSVLKALGEVDSAYQASSSLRRQNELLVTAYAQAQKRSSDAQKLFRYGNKTLDNALTARVDEESMSENLTASRLARAEMLVSLYKALGGGWSPQSETAADTDMPAIKMQKQ